MSLLKHLVPGFVQRPYRDLQKRLDRLELSVRILDMALDALVVSPKYRPADDIGFNGQRHRKQIFKDIQAALPIEAIAETGTWLGNTTAYMAQTAGRPVHSCELNPRFHALAKMRLADVKDTHLELKDSRGFLKALQTTPVAQKSTFFYLDAHWYDDLPLAEEMEIISAGWRRFAVMIDDFKVPDDPGYTYDDYGPGKALALELLQPSIQKHQLSVWFPSARSADETGNRRGCVVLASPGEFSEKLSRVASLRTWPPK
jgi:hypothetical protein